jgi:long-chain acyl-CoA synthetase
MLGTPWLKNYPKGVDWNAQIEPKPIFALLDETAAKFPDNDAIDFEGKTLTYIELAQQVEYAARAFTDIGVKRGIKVGIFLPNCPQFIIAYFGILKAGGTVVNCSPLYSEAEVEFLAKDSDAEIIVTLNLKLLYPKARNILEKSFKSGSKLKKLIVANLPEVLPFPKNILFPIAKRKDIAEVVNNLSVVNWADFMESGKRSNTKIYLNIDPEETAIIQYTGGTTGTPKGAELSHKNVYVNTIQSKLYIRTCDDGVGVMLTVLPLFHVFAMTTAMLYGIATACKIILHPRFDPDKVLKDIEKKKPTAMPGVPTMYNALNNHPDIGSYDLKSLQMCISGGGPLPVEVKKKFEELTGCVVIEGYGLTETSPVATANPVNGVNKPGSIGMPLPATEILIEDMENPGKYLGIGARGELCIKGPQVMKGYYKRPEATTECLKDGILKTGDVAIVDEDGYIFIVDRLKEMIISGGFKIYPRHVEEVLYQHPAVLEAAVIGIPDEYSGQKVKAFVVFKKDASCSKDGILSYCRDKLAKHEMPKEIEIRDALPKSPVGKILKKELK